MALSLAGEPGPTTAGDALAMSPAGLAAYYPPFLPPAQYFEAAPDFLEPLKPLGRLLPSSPPLPPFGIPAFLSQPAALPGEPVPGLPLPPYSKPPPPSAPSVPSEGSPPGPGTPRRAARPPGGGEAAGQSRSYRFTEEELNAVLYGALRSSQLAGSLHAISGLRVPPGSPGKGGPAGRPGPSDPSEGKGRGSGGRSR